MNRMSETSRKVLDLARKQGMIRVRDLTSRGIHPEYLRRLCNRGLLTRVERGLYALPNAEPGAHHDLAEACKRIPHGIICLISALEFHEIGTQIPHEVWIALNRRARKPRVKYPPLRIVRFSGKSLISGVQDHKVENVPVRVYSPAKTVADCFKYRNKIGLDVAIEALKEVRRKRLATVDDLWDTAKVCRVSNVMRPYLEAIL